MDAREGRLRCAFLVQFEESWSRAEQSLPRPSIPTNPAAAEPSWQGRAGDVLLHRSLQAPCLPWLALCFKLRLRLLIVYSALLLSDLIRLTAMCSDRRRDFTLTAKNDWVPAVLSRSLCEGTRPSKQRERDWPDGVEGSIVLRRVTCGLTWPSGLYRHAVEPGTE